jgi:hypothetical protein
MKYKIVFKWGGVCVLAPSNASVLRYGSLKVKPHIVIKGVEYKHCYRCNTWHELSKFHYEDLTWDNLQGYCNKCNTSRYPLKNKFRYKVMR